MSYTVNAFRCKPVGLSPFTSAKGWKRFFSGALSLTSAKLVCVSPGEHLVLTLSSLKAVSAFQNLVMSFGLTVKAASAAYHKKRQWDVVDVVSLTKDFSFSDIVNPPFG